jgi:hypothetical protein
MAKLLGGRLQAHNDGREIDETSMNLYYEKTFNTRYDTAPWDVTFMALSKFQKLPTRIHKMIHNISPAQQV